MTKKSKLLLSVAGALVVSSPVTASVVAGPRPRRSSSTGGRVLIAKHQDVADELRGPDAARRFDVEAEIYDDDDVPWGYRTLLLRLDRAKPAITPETAFRFHPSRGEFDGGFVRDLAMLASSPEEQRGGDFFTLVSVDVASGDVNGLRRDSGGEARRIFRGSDGERVRGARGPPARPALRAERTRSHSGRNFTCGVDHKHHRRGLHGDRSLDSLFDDDHPSDVGNASNGTMTTTESASNDTHHEVDHHHEQPPTFDGLHSHQGTTDSSHNDGFVINLVIVVDADFVERQGGTKPAVEYMNFLASAANVIYEAELGARLNIVRVEETDAFENVTGLREGLGTMRKRFGGTFGEGDGASLVHALLGKDVGGGIAFIDTVCDSKWGVGLSSGLRGVMNDLDDEALFDAFMVAHEIGHSLGSGHTFDDYDPPVDACDGDSCPAGLPLENSATLMSYCHFCEGGLNNVAMTLGGVWNGTEPRRDVGTWEANPRLAGSVSAEPSRVSHRIWTTLSSKGECVRPAPTESPTAAPTAGPTARAPTAAPTAGPTTAAPTAAPTAGPTAPPSSNPTKSPSFFPERPEDGRHWVRPERHCERESNCLAAPGVMFDVSLREKPASHGVLVESVQFERVRLDATLDLYATDGSYAGRERRGDAWRRIATLRANDRWGRSDPRLRRIAPDAGGDESRQHGRRHGHLCGHLPLHGHGHGRIHDDHGHGDLQLHGHGHGRLHNDHGHGDGRLHGDDAHGNGDSGNGHGGHGHRHNYGQSNFDEGKSHGDNDAHGNGDHGRI